jgi:hypothetical protein
LNLSKVSTARGAPNIEKLIFKEKEQETNLVDERGWDNI